jgi:hypothetical protein
MRVISIRHTPVDVDEAASRRKSATDNAEVCSQNQATFGGTDGCFHQSWGKESVGLFRLSENFEAFAREARLDVHRSLGLTLPAVKTRKVDLSTNLQFLHTSEVLTADLGERCPPRGRSWGTHELIPNF